MVLHSRPLKKPFLLHRYINCLLKSKALLGNIVEGKREPELQALEELQELREHQKIQEFRELREFQELQDLQKLAQRLPQVTEI